MSIKYKSPTPSAAMIVPSDDTSTSTPVTSPIPADRVQEDVKPQSGGASPPKDLRAVAEPKPKKARTSKPAVSYVYGNCPGAPPLHDASDILADCMITGTFNEIQAMGYSINGVKLDLAMLSVLTRLGMGKKIGEAPKPPGARGKAAGIWELPLSISFTLTKD